jgi:hypothetical protein
MMKRGREDPPPPPGGPPNPNLTPGQETKYRKVAPKPSDDSESGADVKPPAEAFGGRTNQPPAMGSPILMSPHYP